MREYDEIHDWYAASRSAEVGVADVAAAVRDLPRGARVLDLGCGNGRPIADFLIREGLSVCGVDSSRRMIDSFRANCPTAEARCERAQDSDCFDTIFHAVIAWGVLFHLEAGDQGAVIARVARCLAPGGVFLFTSGEAAGIREGAMNGVAFRYVSLGWERYERLLTQHGLSLLSRYEEPAQNYVYLARAGGTG